MTTVKDFRDWMDRDLADFGENIKIVEETFVGETYFGLIRIGSRDFSIVAGDHNRITLMVILISGPRPRGRNVGRSLA
jgi:hypothetical protein